MEQISPMLFQLGPPGQLALTLQRMRPYEDANRTHRRSTFPPSCAPPTCVSSVLSPPPRERCRRQFPFRLPAPLLAISPSHHLTALLPCSSRHYASHCRSAVTQAPEQPPSSAVHLLEWMASALSPAAGHPDAATSSTPCVVSSVGASPSTAAYGHRPAPPPPPPLGASCQCNAAVRPASRPCRPTIRATAAEPLAGVSLHQPSPSIIDPRSTSSTPPTPASAAPPTGHHQSSPANCPLPQIALLR
jgi:hypothetical protein